MAWWASSTSRKYLSSVSRLLALSLTPFGRADGSKTIQQYAAAAGKQAQNISPSSVQGGTTGSAATAAPSTASTSSSPTDAPKPNAGAAVGGSLHLGLLSGVVAAAGVVAGLLL